ncbi:MAG: Maf family protein [Clostridia bacterium]
MNKQIILASASPRRSDILKTCGFQFDLIVPKVDESQIKSTSPSKLVCDLAKLKANAIDINENQIVISADTVVALDGVIYGKPKDEKEAFDILKSLSNKTHKVFTGVCLKTTSEIKVFYVESTIVFYELSDKEILDYIKTGEPMDKAGAYGIQGKGGLLVKEVHGDYFNIVGLPVARLNRELQSLL